MTYFKKVLWGNTPEDRAELADLERKGAVVKTGEHVRGSDGYMCDAYVMTPRFVYMVFEDLERDGLLVRTGKYRLSGLGIEEPVYVVPEYADEALRRQAGFPPKPRSVPDSCFHNAFHEDAELRVERVISCELGRRSRRSLGRCRDHW